MRSTSNPAAVMSSCTMLRSVRPRKSNCWMAPAVPYVTSSARANAARPAPRTDTRVPSMSNRKRRTLLAGQTAEARDHRGNSLEHRVDLAGSRPAAQREAERALGGDAVAADRAQDVRRLTGHHRAGGARRRGDAAEVELHQDTLGLYPRHYDRDVVRQSRRAAGARHSRLRDLLEEPRQQPIAQPAEPRHLARHLDTREIGRDAHAGDG